jgi:hypothetical protein
VLEVEALGRVEKSFACAAGFRRESEILAQFSNWLMDRALLFRTTVGANRTVTLRFGRFSSVSTGISTGFSAAASDNFFPWPGVSRV